MLKKSIILLKHVGLILFVSKKVLSALMLLLDRKQLFWASPDFYCFEVIVSVIAHSLWCIKVCFQYAYKVISSVSLFGYIYLCYRPNENIKRKFRRNSSINYCLIHDYQYCNLNI